MLLLTGGVGTRVGAVVWWIAGAVVVFSLSAKGTTLLTIRKKVSKKTNPTIPTQTPTGEPNSSPLNLSSAPTPYPTSPIIRTPRPTTRSPPVATTYMAAVAEVQQTASAGTVVSAVAIAAINLQARIITFPENGPNVCNATLTPSACPDPGDGTKVTLPRPDPEQDLSSRCTVDVATKSIGSSSFDSYHCVAKLAKEYQIYIAINMLDVQPCIRNSTTIRSIAAPYNVTNLCQRNNDNSDTGALVYVFNAVVVFSPDGALVAKYYKNALFGASSNVYQLNPTGGQGLAQSTPELSKFFDAEGIFTTTFGITFATLICNDINNHSLLQRIKGQGITDILYANTYKNILSLETIGTTLMALSYFYGFNVVAASTGYAAASGSGVYSYGRDLTTNNNITNSKNTQLSCTTNLAFVAPTESRANCATVRSAMVNAPTTTMSTETRYSWGSTAASNPILWTSDFTGDSLALPVPDAWFSSNGLNLLDPNGLNFTFGHGSTFPRTSPEYTFLTAINQVGILSMFTPPPEPGTYAAHLSFNGITCSARLEFVEGTPAGTGTTRYIFAAYSGDAIFPSTACPESVSYCAVSHCLQFQEGTGACITVPGVGVGAPAPLPSEIAQSITVRGTFANTTFPLAFVSDSDLQPIDMSDLTLSGSFTYEDFEPKSDEKFVTDNATHTIETNGNNAFVTLWGAQKVAIPGGCNVCSNAYDLFNFTDARVPVSARSTFCSRYKDFGS